MGRVVRRSVIAEHAHTIHPIVCSYEIDFTVAIEVTECNTIRSKTARRASLVCEGCGCRTRCSGIQQNTYTRFVGICDGKIRDSITVEIACCNRLWVAASSQL